MALWGDDHENDCRSDPDYFLETGEPYGFNDCLFTQAELELAGIRIDYHRYVEAKLGIYGGRTAAEHQVYAEGQLARLYGIQDKAFEVRTGRTTMTPEDTAHSEQFLREWREKIDREVSEGKWAEDQEAPLYSIVDRARASVFQALSRGSLKATGWVYSEKWHMREKGRDSLEPSDCGSFENIAPSEWTLRGIDWEGCSLSASPKTYEFTQVSTDDLLAVFPRPDGLLGSVSGDMYCDTLIIDDGNGTSEPPKVSHRPRGRPPKADGMAKFAVQNLYAERVRTGCTTEKTEALIQEAIEFVHQAFRVNVSRSTIQAWLTPLRRPEPQNMPEINARN